MIKEFSESIASNFWGFPSSTVLVSVDDLAFDYHKFETLENAKLLKVYLPGVKKDDIVARVEKNSYLCVDYKREENKLSKKFYIDEDVDVDKIKAEYKDGVLEVFLPEKESLTKLIQIE